MIRKLSVAVVTVAILSGCAAERVVVHVNAKQPVLQGVEARPHGSVKVVDIRKHAESERTTIGGLSMGMIALNPPEAVLVQGLIEAQVARVFAAGAMAEPGKVLCGIRVFEISTPATLLYWDVNAKVELVLRVGNQDRIVSGQATERTFIWPSEEIIRRVTMAALDQVGTEAGRALAELAAQAP
jgi:hypothetical protein